MDNTNINISTQTNQTYKEAPQKELSTAQTIANQALENKEPTQPISQVIDAKPLKKEKAPRPPKEKLDAIKKRFIEKIWHKPICIESKNRNGPSIVLEFGPFLTGLCSHLIKEVVPLQDIFIQGGAVGRAVRDETTDDLMDIDVRIILPPDCDFTGIPEKIDAYIHMIVSPDSGNSNDTYLHKNSPIQPKDNSNPWLVLGIGDKNNGTSIDLIVHKGENLVYIHDKQTVIIRPYAKGKNGYVLSTYFYKNNERVDDVLVFSADKLQVDCLLGPDRLCKALNDLETNSLDGTYVDKARLGIRSYLFDLTKCATDTSSTCIEKDHINRMVGDCINETNSLKPIEFLTSEINRFIDTHTKFKSSITLFFYLLNYLFATPLRAPSEKPSIPPFVFKAILPILNNNSLWNELPPELEILRKQLVDNPQEYKQTLALFHLMILKLYLNQTDLPEHGYLKIVQHGPKKMLALRYNDRESPRQIVLPLNPADSFDAIKEYDIDSLNDCFTNFAKHWGDIKDSSQPAKDFIVSLLTTLAQDAPDLTKEQNETTIKNLRSLYPNTMAELKPLGSTSDKVSEATALLFPAEELVLSSPAKTHDELPPLIEISLKERFNQLIKNGPYSETLDGIKEILNTLSKKSKLGTQNKDLVNEITNYLEKHLMNELFLTDETQESLTTILKHLLKLNNSKAVELIDLAFFSNIIGKKTNGFDSLLKQRIEGLIITFNDYKKIEAYFENLQGTSFEFGPLLKILTKQITKQIKEAPYTLEKFINLTHHLFIFLPDFEIPQELISLWLSYWTLDIFGSARDQLKNTKSLTEVLYLRKMLSILCYTSNILPDPEFLKICLKALSNLANLISCYSTKELPILNDQDFVVFFNTCATLLHKNISPEINDSLSMIISQFMKIPIPISHSSSEEPRLFIYSFFNLYTSLCKKLESNSYKISKYMLSFANILKTISGYTVQLDSETTTWLQYTYNQLNDFSFSKSDEDIFIKIWNLKLAISKFIKVDEKELVDSFKRQLTLICTSKSNSGNYSLESIPFFEVLQAITASEKQGFSSDSLTTMQLSLIDIAQLGLNKCLTDGVTEVKNSEYNSFIGGWSKLFNDFTENSTANDTDSSLLKLLKDNPTLYNHLLKLLLTHSILNLKPAKEPDIYEKALTQINSYLTLIPKGDRLVFEDSCKLLSTILLEKVGGLFPQRALDLIKTHRWIIIDPKEFVTKLFQKFEDVKNYNVFLNINLISIWTHAFTELQQLYFQALGTSEYVVKFYLAITSLYNKFLKNHFDDEINSKLNDYLKAFLSNMKIMLDYDYCRQTLLHLEELINENLSNIHISKFENFFKAYLDYVKKKKITMSDSDEKSLKSLFDIFTTVLNIRKKTLNEFKESRSNEDIQTMTDSLIKKIEDIQNNLIKPILMAKIENGKKPVEK